MAKKKGKTEDELAVEQAAKNLGAPSSKRKVKPKAWQLRGGGLLCEEHVAEHTKEDVDKVTPKPGEVCSICSVDLVTGEAGPAPASAPAKPHVNRKKYDRLVRIGLEGDELTAAAAEVTAAKHNLDREEERKREVMAEWKGIISQAEERLQAAFNVLEHGREEVTRVEEVADYDAGTITITRLDNGKVLESRTMTDADSQRPLAGLEDGDSKAMGDDPLEAHLTSLNADELAHVEKEGGPTAADDLLQAVAQDPGAAFLEGDQPRQDGKLPADE